MHLLHPVTRRHPIARSAVGSSLAILVVLVPTSGRFSGGVERPGDLGPGVSGFASSRNSLLDPIGKSVSHAVPIGDGHQLVVGRLEIRQVLVDPIGGLFAPLRSVIQHFAIAGHQKNIVRQRPPKDLDMKLLTVNSFYARIAL